MNRIDISCEPIARATAAALLALVAISLTACTHLQTQTSDTRLGKLSFENGFPSEETTRKVFDELDYQRAVQAYLWAYPAVSFESIRIGTKRDLGVDLNDSVIADNYADPKSRWLTANDTTIYGYTNVDLGKAGPVVVEIPPGAIVGILDDFWQRSISDLGLPGPDRGKGGRYLLLPPGYKGATPSAGYYVLQGTMNNYNVMVRGIVQNGEKDAAVQLVKRVKVYPLSESSNPRPNKFTSMSGKVMDTTPPTGMEFWERLSTFINNNPVQTRDLFYMAMLKPLGIEKGKEFKPDARQRAILEEAARTGDVMGRVMLFEGPDRFRQVGEGLGNEPFPGTKWHWVFQVNPAQQTDTYGQIDERLHYTYGAIYTTPALGVMKAGPGGNYMQAFKDKDGNRFVGGKLYRLRVPANAPAEQFWSLTLYDTATRSMVQNPANDAARSSLDKLKTNIDGSIDLYFGPAGSAPAGQEVNWIETLPGKGFYPMMRFYTPKAGLFDGTWKLPDIEPIK
ncbi:DUF1254 domain-containing protein [Variovorax sp. J31P179]|uniref:DUF1254 domain-containing protein n=1 Tax=Variovorax sp. J31P179 TaxID=3053508 RepID=UPI002577A962|nr:DUF1254 domain-containing protein [Variovorax sp. J31P179]MDM0085469.1 DUF1254 domain-containing protein [Variovorax sp. J31P179]